MTSSAEPIAAEKREEILGRLARVEAEEGVRILLAIESGSRAWGFPSPDSDFDVRFVYCRREEWYFSVDVEEKRDVLEYAITDDIDLNGWDVRKALRLLARSNPTILEWLQSPIQYLSRGGFREATGTLVEQLYAPASGIHHYRSMAKTNYRGYLRADTVPLKKYFYALRPLLAIRWIESRQSPPPIDIHVLLACLHERPDLLAEVAALLEKKKVSAEMAMAAPIQTLNEYIETELTRLEGFSKEPPAKDERLARVSEAFRLIVRQAWAS